MVANIPWIDSTTKCIVVIHSLVKQFGRFLRALRILVIAIRKKIQLPVMKNAKTISEKIGTNQIRAYVKAKNKTAV